MVAAEAARTLVRTDNSNRADNDASASSPVPPPLRDGSGSDNVDACAHQQRQQGGQQCLVIITCPLLACAKAMVVHNDNGNGADDDNGVLQGW